MAPGERSSLTASFGCWRKLARATGKGNGTQGSRNDGGQPLLIGGLPCHAGSSQRPCSAARGRGMLTGAQRQRAARRSCQAAAALGLGPVTASARTVAQGGLPRRGGAGRSAVGAVQWAGVARRRAGGREGGREAALGRQGRCWRRQGLRPGRGEAERRLLLLPGCAAASSPPPLPGRGDWSLLAAGRRQRRLPAPCPPWRSARRATRTRRC